MSPSSISNSKWRRQILAPKTIQFIHYLIIVTNGTLWEGDLVSPLIDWSSEFWCYILYSNLRPGPAGRMTSLDCWLRSVLFCCFCFVLLLWVLLSVLWRLLVCQWDNYPHGQLSYRHKGFVGFWRRQLVMAYLHNLSTYKLVQVLITGWSSYNKLSLMLMKRNGTKQARLGSVSGSTA